MKRINIPNEPSHRIKQLDQFELNPLDLLKNMRNQQISFKHNNVNESERSHLIDYINNLNKQNNFSEKCFHLSCLLLDFILTNRLQTLKKSEINLELIALGCFLLSCTRNFLLLAKFIEDDPILPELSDFKGKTNSWYYDLNEVIIYEGLCIKLLDYKLNYHSAYDFLELLLFNGIILKEEKNKVINSVLRNTCFNVLKMFMHDESFLSFSQIEIAAAVVAYTRYTLQLDELWPSQLDKIYNITYLHIKEIVKIIMNLSAFKPSNTVKRGLPQRRLTVNFANFISPSNKEKEKANQEDPSEDNKCEDLTYQYGNLKRFNSLNTKPKLIGKEKTKGSSDINSCPQQNSQKEDKKLTGCIKEVKEFEVHERKTKNSSNFISNYSTSNNSKSSNNEDSFQLNNKSQCTQSLMSNREHNGVIHLNHSSNNPILKKLKSSNNLEFNFKDVVKLDGALKKLSHMNLSNKD